MFSFILFLLQNSFSKGLPETKHLRGGVFGWVNALSLQRKMWSSLPIPVISFNSSEISLSDITTEFITGQFDINLSQIIQDMLGSLFNETEEDNITDNYNYTDDNEEFVYKFQYQKIISNLPKKITKYYEEDEEYDYDNGDYPDYYEEENKTRYYCDKDLYPNAHLITDMLDGELEFDCATVNNFMGQIFSYVFIIVPLLIIFIITLLYYIVFCFGRCCCCRAKKRFKPRLIEIIFFIIITTFMAITIAFSFTASAYMMKIVNYVFKKGIQKDAETVCQMIDPSIGDGLQNMVNKLVPSIENISNKTVFTIDESLPRLMSILNGTQNNIMKLSDVMRDIQKYGGDAQTDIKQKEATFNECIKVGSSQGCSSDTISEVNFFDQFSDFNKALDSVNEMESAISNVSDVMNVSSFVDSGKDTIVESIDGIRESVDEIGNFSIIDKCDFGEYFELVDDLPSFIVPVAGVVLFLIPIIMLVILLIQVCTFWTKGCCSRCCAACCIPCCVCAFCQLIFGLMATFACFVIIFLNLFYSQGDDVFDTFIKEITNDERTIDFGYLNLSSMTNDVIGFFPLESIKLKKIEFIKNFIDAKLDTPLSKIISLEQLPFNEIADMLEESLTNAANSTNLDDLIVNPIREVINDTKSSLPDVELNDIAQIDKMKESLNNLKNAVENCYQTCNSNFDNLNSSYFNFFTQFNLKQNNFKNTIEIIENSLDATPNEVSLYAYDLFGGLLKTLGKSFASTLRLIIPVLNEFEVGWLIGAFNILRVNFMYNLYTSIICISITSHLYMIGMMAMTTLLWCRRKGMAKQKSEEEEEEEDETDDDDRSVSSDSKKRPKSSGSMKKRGFGRMKVQNYTQSESEEMSSIDDNSDDNEKRGKSPPIVDRGIDINEPRIEQQQISADEAILNNDDNQKLLPEEENENQQNYNENNLQQPTNENDQQQLFTNVNDNIQQLTNENDNNQLQTNVNENIQQQIKVTEIEQQQQLINENENSEKKQSDNENVDNQEQQELPNEKVVEQKEMINEKVVEQQSLPSDNEEQQQLVIENDQDEIESDEQKKVSETASDADIAIDDDESNN